MPSWPAIRPKFSDIFLRSEIVGLSFVRTPAEAINDQNVSQVWTAPLVFWSSRPMGEPKLRQHLGLLINSKMPNRESQ